jgi:hypothetical protein
MAELPPPGASMPAPVPRPPAATPEQIAAARRSTRKWLIIAGAVLVLFVGVQFLPERKDDPPPSRAELAEQTWDRMSLSEQAAICDGYNQFGESFTVDNLLDGTDGDERMARALLDVVKDEC